MAATDDTAEAAFAVVSMLLLRLIQSGHIAKSSALDMLDVCEAGMVGMDRPEAGKTITSLAGIIQQCRPIEAATDNARSNVRRSGE